jgi:hypothetical protein
VVREVIQEWLSLGQGGALTLAVGGDDPEAHTLVPILAGHAKSLGVTHVHARTSLRCDQAAARALAQSGVDVISVDLLAETPATYRAVTGNDDFDRALANLDILLEVSPRPLVVPRLTRCDATYAEVEPFFSRWMERAGWCVLDPLPGARPGERIGPLPRPASARAREDRERLTILADGAVLDGPCWSPDDRTIVRVPEQSLGEAWSRAVRARFHGRGQVA